jgi:hypothetical protein
MLPIMRTHAGEVIKDPEAKGCRLADLKHRYHEARARTAGQAEAARRAFAEACPVTPGDGPGFKAFLSKWRKRDQENGGIIYLEMEGGFDGDYWYGNIDTPRWGLFSALLRWGCGLGWHELHYPETYLPALREFIEAADADYASEGHGERVVVSKATYDKLDAYLDGDCAPGSPKEEDELRFAEELRTKLEDIRRDCLEQHVLTLGFEDALFLAAAQSRIPGGALPGLAFAQGRKRPRTLE